MAKNSDKPGAELFKGVMLAHLILGLHLALFALIGLLVIFFGGIARYWGWILLAGLVLAALAAWVVYRKLKAQGRNIVQDLRGVSVPAGSTLEVSFLGGLASVKFARPAHTAPQIAAPAAQALLEDPETQRIRELANLAQMYEKKLLTREEFEHAKGAILNPPHRTEFGPGTLEN
jgi:thiol:disulfide interchange protein